MVEKNPNRMRKAATGFAATAIMLGTLAGSVVPANAAEAAPSGDQNTESEDQKQDASLTGKIGSTTVTFTDKGGGAYDATPSIEVTNPTNDLPETFTATYTHDGGKTASITLTRGEITDPSKDGDVTYTADTKQVTAAGLKSVTLTVHYTIKAAESAAPTVQIGDQTIPMKADSKGGYSATTTASGSDYSKTLTMSDNTSLTFDPTKDVKYSDTGDFIITYMGTSNTKTNELTVTYTGITYKATIGDQTTPFAYKNGKWTASDVTTKDAPDTITAHPVVTAKPDTKLDGLNDITLTKGKTSNPKSTASDKLGVVNSTYAYTYADSSNTFTLSGTASYEYGTEITLKDGTKLTNKNGKFTGSVTTTLDTGNKPATTQVALSNDQKLEITWKKAERGFNDGKTTWTASGTTGTVTIEVTDPATNEKATFTVEINATATREEGAWQVNVGNKAYDLTATDETHMTGDITADTENGSLPDTLNASEKDGSTPVKLTHEAKADKINADGKLTTTYKGETEDGRTITVTLTVSNYAWTADVNGTKVPLTYKDGTFTGETTSAFTSTPADSVTVTDTAGHSMKLNLTVANAKAADAGKLGRMSVTGTADYNAQADNTIGALGIKGFTVTQPVTYQVGSEITFQQDGSDKPGTFQGKDGAYTAAMSTTLGEDDKPDTISAKLSDGTNVTVQLGAKTQTEPDDKGNTFARRIGKATGEITVKDPISDTTLTQGYTLNAVADRAWNDSITGLAVVDIDPTAKNPQVINIDGFDAAKHEYTIERPYTAVKDSFSLGYTVGADAGVSKVDVKVGAGASRVLTFTVNQGRANAATYTVTVNFGAADIQPDSPAKLTAIQWSKNGSPDGPFENVPNWDPNRLDYVLTVGENDPSPYVIPRFDNSVTVEPGKVTQTSDSTRQEWKVTAKTGESRVYSVTVVREHSWKTAAEEFTPGDPVAQEATVQPDSPQDGKLASHGYVLNGKYVPVKDDTYLIPEGGVFSYEPKVGQSVGVTSRKMQGMTYEYTATVLPPDQSYPQQETFTVTYLTQKTHTAALTGIKVNGQDIQGFSPDKYEYEVPVADPAQWMVSPVYDKLLGMTIDTDKQGDTANIKVTSADGLVTVTYKVHVVNQASALLAKTGTSFAIAGVVAAVLVAIAGVLYAVQRRLRRKSDELIAEAEANHPAGSAKPDTESSASASDAAGETDSGEGTKGGNIG